MLAVAETISKLTIMGAHLALPMRQVERADPAGVLGGPAERLAGDAVSVLFPPARAGPHLLPLKWGKQQQHRAPKLRRRFRQRTGMQTCWMNRA